MIPILCLLTEETADQRTHPSILKRNRREGDGREVSKYTRYNTYYISVTCTTTLSVVWETRELDNNSSDVIAVVPLHLSPLGRRGLDQGLRCLVGSTEACS